MKLRAKLISLVFIVSSLVVSTSYAQTDTCDDSLAILLPFGQDFISDCDVVILSQYKYADLSITKSKFDKIAALYPEYKKISEEIDSKVIEKDSIQSEIDKNSSISIGEVKSANIELQKKVDKKNGIIKVISGALIISVLLNIILTN